MKYRPLANVDIASQIFFYKYGVKKIYQTAPKIRHHKTKFNKQSKNVSKNNKYYD